jgi:hypothetical protein
MFASCNTVSADEELMTHVYPLQQNVDAEMRLVAQFFL